MGELLRTVRISTRHGEARAVVEDDFHHFRVSVFHDGKVVTSVTGEAPRHPWTLCAYAATRLSELVGMPLSSRAQAVAQYAAPRLQCTHQFDLAGLAVAAAARGIARRRYDVSVTDPVDERRTATLSRDGRVLLSWTLQHTLILDPPPFKGRALRAEFAAWASENLSEDECEAALVLRRAIFISGGREVDLDQLVHASATGGCIVNQPKNAERALRMKGATIDFSRSPAAPTQSDDAWLSFTNS